MKPFLFLLFLINSLITIGQEDFSGKISWKIERGKETFYRDVYVKNDSIKIEEWNKLTPKNKSVIIMDLKTRTSNIVSNERKTYLVLQPKDEELEKIDFTFQTEEAVDSLMDLSISKWIVDAYNLSHTTVYWFSASNFIFYRKMLELLPDKNFLEKQFLQLPISQEVMPIKAEYSNINKVQVTSMEVIQIENTKLPDVTFKIPKSYKAF